MTAVFIDSTILLHAAGGDHAMRAPSRRWLEAVASGGMALHASVEAGQEFLFHRLRKSTPEQATAQFGLIDGLITWHPFDEEVLRRSVALAATGALGGRDAVHAATALAAGSTEIVSADRDFDKVPGLARRDPGDLPD